MARVFVSGSAADYGLWEPAKAQSGMDNCLKARNANASRWQSFKKNRINNEGVDRPRLGFYPDSTQLTGHSEGSADEETA